MSDNKNQTDIIVDGEVFTVDYSKITRHDGRFIVIKPKQYENFEVALPHIPYFDPYSEYIKDGQLTEKAITYFQPYFQKVYTFSKSLNSIDKEDFYNRFWEKRGEKNLHRLQKSIKKKKQITAIILTLKHTLHSKEILDNQEKSYLFQILNKEKKSVNDKINTFERESKPTIAKLFSERTGIEKLNYDELKKISNETEIFSEDKLMKEQK